MADRWDQLKFDTVDLNNIDKKILSPLESGLNKLSNITSVLRAILDKIQLFTNTFQSFSSLIASTIGLAQRQLNTWIKDLSNTGIYMNVLVPPSFNKSMLSNGNWQKLSTGGYPGFLGRLQVSLYNQADPQRPIFGENAEVGGFIMMVDAVTLEDFYAGLDQLKGLFGNIFDFLPINTTPPPPQNIRSFPVYDPTNTEKPYGIRLIWDKAPGTPVPYTFYKLSRSDVSGGERTVSNPVPSKLWGKDGIIQGSKIMVGNLFSKDKGQWPPKESFEYKDEFFNSGKPVTIKANIIDGHGEYMDRDIPMDPITKQPIKTMYYYVVESGFPGIWGPHSVEVYVPVEKKCVDPDTAIVIEHARGFQEEVSPGWGGLGQWSAIQAKGIIPALPQTVDFVSKFLNKLSGMTSNASSSLSSFLQGIQDKFDDYLGTITIIRNLIAAVKKIFLGPNLAFLNIPPATGGVSKFMSRVRNALPVDPDKGFSGSTGITAGIVFMYGSAARSPLGETDQATLRAQNASIAKTFGMLLKILS